MSTTGFEFGMQPAARFVRGDVGEEPGGGQEFFSGEALGVSDITELVVPVARVPFPALKFFGFLWFRDGGNYDQQIGGGDLQSFVFRMYDNGVPVGPTITFFDTGNEITDADSQDQSVIIDMKLTVLGDMVGDNLQHVEVTVILTNTSTSTERKRETKSFCLQLNQNIDHDIGYGFRKKNALTWVSNNLKLRSFNGVLFCQRSGS